MTPTPSSRADTKRSDLRSDLREPQRPWAFAWDCHVALASLVTPRNDTVRFSVWTKASQWHPRRHRELLPGRRDLMGDRREPRRP